MLDNELFVNAVRGAVDSYIRMINEPDSDDTIGLGIVSPKWYYYIDCTNEDFVILLDVKGKRKEIVLQKQEWKSHQANFLGSSKLIQFAKMMM